MNNIDELIAKKGFPRDWSDEELNERLESLDKEMLEEGNGVLQRLNVYTNRALRELESRDNKRNNLSNKRLAIAAIAISFLAMLHSLYTNYQSEKLSKDWKEHETQLLREIREGLTTLK